MAQFVGAVRFVYNLALEQRKTWYRPGRQINFTTQCHELTALRAEEDWIRAAPARVLQQALRDLESAYKNWWAGRAKAPTPRKRGRHDSMRFPDPGAIEIRRTGKSSGQIKLQKLGWVRFRGWYELHGDVCNATVRRQAGQWFVSVQCEREAPELPASVLPATAMDFGIVNLATFPDGSKIEAANHGRNALKTLRRAQRDLARKRRGSNNRRKATRRVARIHQRVANARKDFLHKASTHIAKSHGVVFVEALKVRNMTASAAGTVEAPGRKVRQKAGLNRAILDQGWGIFRGMLDYKLAERGGELIDVDPRNTSRKCTKCHLIDPASRISQARFVCTGCGNVAHADTNAAINILQRGLAKSLKPAEGHRPKRPCEAGSIRGAASCYPSEPLSFRTESMSPRSPNRRRLSTVNTLETSRNPEP